MKFVLTCAPDHFSIDYEINPWMDTSNKVNQKLAQEEFASLMKVYEKLNIPVRQIGQTKGLPDMVYTANFGFAKDNVFIPAQFKHPERQPETEIATEYFTKLGFEIKRLPEDIIYEGEGDHLMTPDGRHFMGYGKRSQKEAAGYLSKLLGTEVTPLELVDPYFYHLDTAFSPLTDDLALVNPRSFTRQGLEVLQSEFKDLIKTSEADNRYMAPNLLRFNQDLVMAEGISAQLQNDLAERGFNVHTVSTSEFLKGGGSIKCLSLQIH